MNLELLVNGQLYGGWTEATLRYSLREAAAAFTLAVTDRWPGQDEAWRIEVGAACELRLEGATILKGYVDRRAPTYDKDSAAVRIAGRSRTCDLVDCSVLVDGGQFRGYDLAQIARALAAPFGVEVVVEAPVGKPFADVQVQQGETVFELVERLSRLRGLAVAAGLGGELLLTRTGAERAAVALRQGENILAAAGGFAADQRFSDYVVRGQQAGSDRLYGAAAAQVEGAATDEGVTRYRPLLVLAEGQSDGATATERARWQAKTRAANGVSAEVTVQGWQQGADGPLWRINQLVSVWSPRLDLDQATDLLVADADFSLDAGGTRTRLTLVPPEAFTPEPGGEAGSGGGAADPWAGVKAIS